MTSQPGYQGIVMYMLLYILRSKSNEIMKLGQLLKYNIRNNFYEKSYTKYRGKATPKLFSKKSKLGISLDQQSKVLHNLFLLYAKLKAIEIYRN